MKKHGFTLAEVLVTLGIIGVVAALTTPALIQNVGNAKVGPKLQKAKATFETAAEMLLVDESANSLFGITEAGNGTNSLGGKLSKYMKISPAGTVGQVAYNNYDGSATFAAANQVAATLGQKYNSDDGLTYYIRRDNTVTHPRVCNASDANCIQFADTPNNQKIGEVWVDINSADSPNAVAKDLFGFYMYNDGTLRPMGAKYADRSAEESAAHAAPWAETGGSGKCNSNTVENSGINCTGSIFDNGLKIIYQ